MNERRRFSRVNIIFEAEVEFQGRVYSAEIINLALKGVLLTIKDFAGKKNDLCEISITVSEDVIMTFQSKLVHHQGNNFGFKFETSDLDSISHLRKCLEFNVNDPKIIEEELFFLATGHSE
ncbi:PilZ domain-containing protein [Gloeothece verrucosa]|uniref:Type IV pilus assembly PilZ n=1 Tax=Gloeothece verrucosa (strain PCC 7822) TaxID=497965 RepID=E0UJU2_GLOV7|nr:PilZ domain-containing protein [Gloeothece verrucosa]ADN13453.1 type IV pilus assembly PilZ [Gloeothece verrucosa PCC 7822]